MPRFLCKKCGRRINADFEACCAHPTEACSEKPPECCGQPMIEILDDY